MIGQQQRDVDWWHRVREHLDADRDVRPSSVDGAWVAIRSPVGAERQRYADGRLERWEQGDAPDARMLLALGEHGGEAQVQGDPHVRDLFGLHPEWTPVVPERHRGARGAIGGLATRTPVGDIGFRLDASGDSCLKAEYGEPGPWLAEVDVQIVADYAHILRWLHDDDVTLGNLIIDGMTVDGDLFALTTTEGLICAEGPARLPADLTGLLVAMGEARAELVEAGLLP